MGLYPKNFVFKEVQGQFPQSLLPRAASVPFLRTERLLDGVGDVAWGLQGGGHF